ncbi:MAG: hypothetical protein ACKOAU_08905 [Pirellula sp.]
MIGAIAGDVIGSVHEGAGTKTKDFPLFQTNSRFTDDTVLTLAVASQLLRGGSYFDAFHEFFHAYPMASRETSISAQYPTAWSGWGLESALSRRTSSWNVLWWGNLLVFNR